MRPPTHYSSSHLTKTIWKSQLSFLGERQKCVYPSPGIQVGSSILSAFHNHDKTKAEAGVRKIEVTMGHEKIKGFLTQESGEASAH